LAEEPILVGVVDGARAERQASRDQQADDEDDDRVPAD
jgi:hypothetical protein